MHMTVRRCTQCGREDLRERWDSIDAAVRARAMSAVWTCPACAWTEADLVEATADVGRPPTTTEADRDPAQPTDPDEARRAAETSFPFRW